MLVMYFQLDDFRISLYAALPDPQNLWSVSAFAGLGPSLF